MSLKTRRDLGILLAGLLASAVVSGHLRAQASGPASRPAHPWEASPSIEPAALRHWVEFLEDPALAGREAGTAGIDRASQAILERFAAWGLAPAPGAPHFRQEFQLGHLALGSPQRLLVEGRRLTLFGDFVPRPDSGNGTARGLVVPVGPGVAIPELGVDFLAGKQLAGKIALIDREGWAELMPRYRELDPQRRNQVRQRIFQRGAILADLARLGAVGAISFRRPPTARSSGTGRQPPSAAEEPGKLGFLQGIQVSRKREASIPALEVTREVGLALAGKQVELEVNLDYQTREAANILALIPGGDPAAAAVVLATHLDGRAGGERIGAGPAGPRTPENAAGLALLLEVARVLARREERLPRPVLIALFSARHVSLAGSRHYMAQPALPPAATLAMINLESPERAATAQDLPLIAEIPPEAAGLSFLIVKAATRNGLPISLEELRPSFNGDHWPFFDQRIPVAHLHRSPAPPSPPPPGSRPVVDYRRLEQSARALLDLAQDLCRSAPGEVRWLERPR